MKRKNGLTKAKIQKSYDRILMATEEAGDQIEMILDLLADVYDVPVEIILDKLK